MTASNTDKFKKAKRQFSTTIAAGGFTAGATTLPLTSTSGLDTDTAITLVIAPGEATEEVITGVVSGSNVINCVRGKEGTTDQNHSAGDAVAMYFTETHWDDLIDGILAEHKQTGAHSTITAESITTSALTVTGTATTQGWTALGQTPNTVTANGNRNYDLVFNSVDLSGTLSPGMKLQLARTVAAPDQCADLEASSSQYFSKSSPAGMTFTDDFTVSAWVKLESYTSASIIASRYNGTNGWDFSIGSDGRPNLNGYNAGGGNQSGVVSYASIPLNKWVHVAAQLDMSTYTATTTTSYIMIDGVDVTAQVYRSGTNPTALVQAGNLEVGSRNGGTSPFDGKIAQVAIYNAKVTQANIRATMSQGLTGSETSLISAYSLDNSINDLNTTNANNLTAQNSAAATATDSPFANAVSAGLLEYAEINSVAFSTNTTVNVRVPDTCMIPTSGGVSAVSYSTQSNPYGLPFISRVLGYAQICSSPTATTSTTTVAIPGLATTFYAPANAKLKITICDGISTGNTTTNAQTILVGTIGDPTSTTNRIVEGIYQAFANGAIGQIYREGIYIPTTSGSLTAYMGHRVSAGTSAHSCDVTRPMYLKVELA